MLDISRPTPSLQYSDSVVNALSLQRLKMAMLQLTSKVCLLLAEDLERSFILIIVIPKNSMSWIARLTYFEASICRPKPFLKSVWDRRSEGMLEV